MTDHALKQSNLNGHSVTWFEAGTGEAFVFLHGFPLDHSMWIHQLNEFATDARVIAPDLPGLGQSSLVEGLSKLQDVANWLAEFLDHLGVDRFNLVGLSMGGYISWEIASRFQDRVSRLILMDTRAAKDSSEVARGRNIMAEKLEREGADAVAEIADAMIVKLFAANSFREASWEVEQTRKVILNTNPASIALYQRAMANREDFSQRLAEFKMPALFLCGEHDQISTVAEMREISRGLPQASFVEIPHAGHMAPLEDPETSNLAIRKFLRLHSLDS